MIKLTQLISELGVTNPNPTAEYVKDYYIFNIGHNNNEFGTNGNGWKEYKEICQPYLEKYGIRKWLSIDDFEQLSQPDLNKFYRKLKQLVQKYAN